VTQTLGRYQHRAAPDGHIDGSSAAGRPPGTIAAEEPTVWQTLLRAQVRISRHLQTDLLAEHDLALGSYDVLRHLGEAPGGRLRMNDLADRVLLSRSGLTRLIDRLHREGLVVRESCASDARGLFAVLTPKGFERLAEATPTYQRGVRDHVVSRLDHDELCRLGSILDKLIAEPAHHSAA
jgi:DNA-binding MarR family transcriptional regulator